MLDKGVEPCAALAIVGSHTLADVGADRVEQPQELVALVFEDAARRVVISARTIPAPGRVDGSMSRILALPAPRTPGNLAVVGLELAIEVEGRISTLCIENEDAMLSVTRAILAAPGTTLPAVFLGFRNEPGS